MTKSLLRVERYLKGLRQADLATMTAIPQTTISRIECGRRIPSPEEKRAIAQVLGLKPSDLWPGEEAQS
jgi:transcriptional regulator with XRE-family HTH domain